MMAEKIDKRTEGIDVRHQRTCRLSNGGACDCSPSYQAHVWDAKAGKRLRKTFSTPSAAKRWRQDAMVALRRGDLTADRGPRLKDATTAWLDALRSGAVTNRSGDPYKPGTIRSYEKELRLRVLPVLGDMRVNEITAGDVQELVDDLIANGLAPATIDVAITPLKAFYRRAVARREARVNPAVGIEKPAVRYPARRVVSPAEADAMIAALDGQDRVLWATAFYTGLRRGELIALRREDVDLATGLVHVRRGWDHVEGEIEPKSRHGRRRVPITAVLRDHLDQHLLSHDRERVFASAGWVAKAGDRARDKWTAQGLPVITLHEARHVYASFAIAAGLNAKTLCSIMGHGKISVTFDLYGHLLPGSEDEAAMRLDAYFSRQADGSTVARTVAHPAESAL
jgi:integrase